MVQIKEHLLIDARVLVLGESTGINKFHSLTVQMEK
jgi:hypothetical protein